MELVIGARLQAAPRLRPAHLTARLKAAPRLHPAHLTLYVDHEYARMNVSSLATVIDGVKETRDKAKELRQRLREGPKPPNSPPPGAPPPRQAAEGY